MLVKCVFCGKPFDASFDTCPGCGAVNMDQKLSEYSGPRTIAELQAYIDANNIPASIIRFFIGTDCGEPTAFGIFKKDAQTFVVYENGNDGKRLNRYTGTNEAYAVSLIYEKLVAVHSGFKEKMDRLDFFSGGNYGRGKPDPTFWEPRKRKPAPPEESDT
ncbi:MAG: hypothetical protein IKS75_08530 [Clostridiales bacterium]|nr:hypothetical protein [Clostridiales bacterium]